MEEEGRYYRCSEDEPAMKRCRFRSDSSSKQEKKKKNEKVVVLCLPDELVIEILEWLPIKSLARFRCVAKPWSAIFKRPAFIKNHRRKQGSKARMLLVRRCLPPQQFDGTDDDDVFSFHDLDSPEAAEVRPFLSITFLKDLVGLEKITYNFNFIGPCNGIVCIRYGRRHILCNPALREFKLLPPYFSDWPQGLKGRWVAQGFGVANDNDFKVVVMHKIYDKKSNIKDRMNKSYVVMVHLYSSRTNSWRRIDDAPVFPVVQSLQGYILLNGACHWLGRTFAQDHKTILSFDIESEVFRQLELPNCLCRLDIADALPIVLNEGCLGLVQYQEWFSKLEPVEVWGMKEYGVRESWTKMFVISPQPLAMTFLHWKNDILFMVHEPIFGLPSEQRIQHQDDGLLYEELNGQLTSISVHTNEIKNFPVCGVQKTMNMLIYEESLVSVN